MDLVTTSNSGLPTIATRVWSTEQDGPNDRAVDVWNPTTGNWIPAFFKDIKKGDFYLLIGLDLETGRCFLAGSDVKRFDPPERWGQGRSPATFLILGGSEIVQAPSMIDINPALIEAKPNPKRIK